MSVQSRVKTAYEAMKTLGIREEISREAVRALYHIYDKNWDPIEAEDYRVLVDYIFENQEQLESSAAAAAAKKRKDSQLPQPPTKKFQQSNETSNSTFPSTSSRERERDKQKQVAEQEPDPISFHRHKLPAASRDNTRAVVSAPVSLKHPKLEPGIHHNRPNHSNSNTLIKPKTYDTSPVPIAIMSPSTSRHQVPDADTRRINKQNSETSLVLASSPEDSSSNFLLASSTSGEVKISLSCNPSIQLSTLQEAIKSMDSKCKSYTSGGHSFSFEKMMKQLCKCISDGNLHISAASFNAPLRIQSSADGVISQYQGSRFLNGQASQCKNVARKSLSNGYKKKNLATSQSSDLVLIPQQRYTINDERPPHDTNDISKGEERVKIPVINDLNDDLYPPSFQYIPHNTVYQNAYINFSLARIGDEDCCSSCYGDCMLSSIPCACARETGGEFAYTREGLIKQKFLEECISMNHYSPNHHRYYCQDCPLERAKNEVAPEQCKGHLLRKFIKECWSKCGCNKGCGNRVVQRGITRSLQVFLTPEGKGWGLRTVEYLPRGAFVCEYVGEILTNTELYERNIERTGDEKHTYPVLLDADWGSESVLKDEEALCLDATCYGNVARFINHRCVDGNLIAIPVEVETPDHHYYHLAFFTEREVNALEELTWDYGIDFDDHAHPIKAFECCCGSKSCRGRKGKGLMALITH